MSAKARPRKAPMSRPPSSGAIVFSSQPTSTAEAGHAPSMLGGRQIFRLAPTASWSRTAWAVLSAPDPTAFPAPLRRSRETRRSAGLNGARELRMEEHRSLRAFRFSE